MSVTVPLNTLTLEQRRHIARECKCKETRKQNTRQPIRGAVEVLEAYSVDTETDLCYLPMVYGQSIGLPRKSRDLCRSIRLNFNKSLYPEQEEILAEVRPSLKNTGAVLISIPTGAGKTLTAVYIATRLIKLQTLIIIPGITVLIPQWVEEITESTGGMVQILKGKTVPNPEADFYVVNALNLPKIPRDSLQTVGTVIVDEVHAAFTRSRLPALLHISARYIIGLSATPFRPDGFHNTAMPLFFGSTVVSRRLNREHDYYKITTDFTPETRQSNAGCLDWGYILEQQGDCTDRDNIVVQLVADHPERTVLVFCKRTSHVTRLGERLVSEGFAADTLYGSKTTFDKTSQVLVSNVQKSGVGFNWKSVDMIIIAADIAGVGTEEEGNYFVQYLGRSMRRRDSRPVVFDIVDNNGVLKRHHKNRVKLAKKVGGFFHGEYPAGNTV